MEIGAQSSIYHLRDDVRLTMKPLQGKQARMFLDMRGFGISQVLVTIIQ